MEDQRRHDENFFTLRVKLSTDFTTLSNVQVVVDSLRAEHIALQAYDTDKQ